MELNETPDWWNDYKAYIERHINPPSRQAYLASTKRLCRARHKIGMVLANEQRAATRNDLRAAAVHFLNYVSLPATMRDYPDLRSTYFEDDFEMPKRSAGCGTQPPYIEPAQALELLNRLRLKGEPALYTMAVVLYSTGARRSEVVNLKIGDFHDGASPYLDIRKGKFGKQRRLTLFRFAADTITRHLGNHRKPEDPNAYLFESNTGGSADKSMEHLSGLVRELAVEMGIVPDGSRHWLEHPLHFLRYLFATHMNSADDDALTLQYAMGHESRNQTDKYILSNPGRVGKMMEKHPLAQAEARRPGAVV